MKKPTTFLLLLVSIYLALMVSCETKPTPNIFNPNITYGSMIDIDGNTYKTVVVGTQTWMAENLKVTKYNDGTDIPNVIDAKTWTKLTNGALCDYNNTPLNSEKFGKLYNWFAVETEKICPTGWHVPSNDEWITLTNYLISNGYNYDGTNSGDKIAKALASPAVFWLCVNCEEGTICKDDYIEKQNASGFSAIGVGARYGQGEFLGIENEKFAYACWWSSTEINQDYANGRALFHLDSSFGGEKSRINKVYGHSIRCVKD